jgi:hypothetical protein
MVRERQSAAEVNARLAARMSTHIRAASCTKIYKKLGLSSQLVNY